jgi:hypothetical protein
VTRLKKEDGYAVVLAFVMLLVLMIILTAVFSLVSNEIKFVSHAKNSIKTFYTAEAGLEYAGSLLSSSDLANSTIWSSNELDPVYLGKINDIIENNITLTKVKKNESGNEITLISTATHDSGIEKTIEVKYEKLSYGSDVYNYSLVSNGNIDLKNKIIVEGTADDDFLDDLDYDGDGIPNIEDPDADGDGTVDTEDGFADGTVDPGDGFAEIDHLGTTYYYDPRPDYYGDIYTTGFITDKSKTELINSEYKDISTDSDLEDIVPDMYTDLYSQFEDKIIGVDDPDDNFYKDEIPKITNGNYVFNNDVAYSNTNLTFDNGDTIKGSGVLLVNGDIEFKNGVDISTGENENLLIVASGNITFKNSSGFSGMVYAGGKIDIKAKVDIKGSVISKIAIEETTIIVHSGGNDPSEIVYDNSYLEVFENLGIELPTLDTGSGYDLKIVSWEES